MAKKRQPAVDIPRVAFSSSRPLGVEVLSLSDLIRRRPVRRPGRPHRPDFHHLLLVTKGRGSHVIDFVRHSLAAGMVVSVAAGQVHQFGHEPTLEARLVVFRPEALSRAMSLEPCLRLPPDRWSLANTLVEGLASACAAAADGKERSRALVFALLHALVRTVDVGPERPERGGLLGRFHAAVEREFRRAHEVAAYAAILRCSTRTLTRHCLRVEGRPAKRVIDDRLVLEARRHLAHADLSVAALSAELGFSEPTHFVKFFRRVSGETPGQFRARHGWAPSPQP
jgi:AraC-like DNA-binding protein